MKRVWEGQVISLSSACISAGKQWHAHEGAGFPPTERFGHVAVGMPAPVCRIVGLRACTVATTVHRERDQVSMRSDMA